MAPSHSGEEGGSGSKELKRTPDMSPRPRTGVRGDGLEPKGRNL